MSNSVTAPVADRPCNSEIANTCLSLRARNVGRIDSTEICPAHTDARHTPPVARPGQRAASEPFPAAGRPRVQEPAPSGDFQVPQLVLSLDREIPSDLSLLDGAVAEITAAIGRTSCWEDTESIDLATQEALTNAIVHGNHCDPTKTTRVSVSVNEDCDLLIVVKDSGAGFDPSKITDPTAAENLLANHGKGIFLMKQLMDQVDFKFDNGTEVRMCVGGAHGWSERTATRHRL